MISRALFLFLLARVLIVRIEYRFKSPDCTDISLMLSSMIVSFLLSSERAHRGGVLRTACNACIKINSAYTILITWHTPFRASTSLCAWEASQTRVWPRVRSPVKHRRWELRDSLDTRFTFVLEGGEWTIFRIIGKRSPIDRTRSLFTRHAFRKRARYYY